ncbi:TDT family transporter [Gordonia sp. PKS22-38]|uniref:TDT family transporter n=1 Tax=Gordonia prachuapensis TaxID=3115651 RepID=A0ABU7MPR5_9ACTN|nr:TDT family transporter [Gordonia sp. PKS22-38]
MSITLDVRRAANRRLLTDLDHPRQVFEHLTPNWFAAVMGTGIVANAAVALPMRSAALDAFATAIWAAAAILLATIATAFVVHWVRHRENARGYAADPVMSHFYGAPPMALLTVGAGTLSLGGPILGDSVALWTSVVLWSSGTALGVLTAVWVPFTMMTAPRRSENVALPAWLMPVVPPMVSAATGAALIAHVPTGQPRLAMLTGCYALFGVSLVLGLMTMTMIYARLTHGGVPESRSAPTIWITLGMIGQSVTAANLLAAEADHVFTGAQAPIATGLAVFGIVVGLAMGGFGVAMFALATAVTVRAVRRSLPFALTWWSFTFPVGTCVTGLLALGAALDAAPIRALGEMLFVVLVAAWATVAVRTARAAVRGSVFRPV